jgi:hypothetical protein
LIYLHNGWHAADARDRHDIADEIESLLFVERRVDRVHHRDLEKCVTVRGRSHDRFDADIAARAGSVVDNELLAEALGQPLTHQAREDVGRTTWWKTDDDAHRPRRIGLRPRNARQSGQHGSASGEMQKLPSVGKLHRALS